MPRVLTERPLSEHVVIVYRLKRQTDLSSELTDARKKKIKAHYDGVLTELQRAENLPPARKVKR